MVFRYFINATMIVAFFGSSAHAGQITALYYTSSPASWVGNGQTVLVTPSNGFDFAASRNFDMGVSFAINDFAHNPNFQTSRWWYLDFAAPFNQPLHVGYYPAATRFPFQAFAVPGFSFVGNGRGDNTLTGFFDVLEVVYAGEGSVLSFAGDFTQYDETILDWWNQGSIRYNSSIPLFASVPEPASVSLTGLGIVGLILGITLRWQKELRLWARIR